MLTIAVAKGRIQDSLKSCFVAMNIPLDQLESRKLIIAAPNQSFRLVFLKSIDIPSYVSQGSVDLGIVGRDVVLEAELPLFEIESLDMATCSLCLAGPADFNPCQKNLRIATKYPTLTRSLFEERSEQISIIHLEGSVEIAPLIGLSDCIVDIVESGETLKANALIVYETLMGVFPLVVANTISYKTNFLAITQWLETFNRCIKTIKNT